MAAIYDYLSSFLSSGKKYSEEKDDKKLKPDKYAKDPNLAWSHRKSKGKQTAEKVEPLALGTPVYDDKVRFVCISDTHTYLERNKNYVIPDGDVLLHAGDLTMYGKPDEVEIVNTFLGTLRHPYKVVIAGNHDMSFDLDFLHSYRLSPFWTLNNRDFKSRLQAHGVETVHEMMTNCVYLQDSAVEIYGIKIYGSPWSSGSGAWGFQAPRGAPILDKWSQIPEDTDILITHGPPCGHGDCMVPTMFKAMFGQARDHEDHVGCVDLLNTIQHRVRPSYHLFGHIHEGYGLTMDGTTTFVNAATCTVNYVPVNKPIIFDIPLPEGQKKTKVVPPGTYKALSYKPEKRTSTASRRKRREDSDAMLSKEN